MKNNMSKKNLPTRNPDFTFIQQEEITRSFKIQEEILDFYIPEMIYMTNKKRINKLFLRNGELCTATCLFGDNIQILYQKYLSSAKNILVHINNTKVTKK